jgi:hypothetical protein
MEAEEVLQHKGILLKLVRHIQELVAEVEVVLGHSLALPAVLVL